MSTLALNMIVGPGEAGLLKRCLESFNAKEFFDEIVLVNTSNDNEVDTVALQYTEKVYRFCWESDRYPYGNFGGAREMARQKSVSDKIMWLDTDDACLKQYEERWKNAVRLIKNNDYKDVMIWVMPYAIIVDENGNPASWFKRERVFDRTKIIWKRPIHEMMFPGIEMVKNASINNMFITHLPTKPTYSSAIRNVKILEHEYSYDKSDVQTRYFLGRDYMYTGKTDEGIALLDGIMSEMSASYDMLYSIAMELCWFYAYGSNNPRPIIEMFKRENINKAESWARLAMIFGNSYAEPYVLLGDVYKHRGEFDAARKMYALALKKKPEGKFSTGPMYQEVPSERLSRVFESQGNLGMAINYIDRAIQLNPISGYINYKKAIVQALYEQFN